MQKFALKKIVFTLALASLATAAQADDIVRFNFNSVTADANPSTGTTTMNQMFWAETKSIPALSTKVTPTTRNPPASPPSNAPRPALPMLDKRAPTPAGVRPAVSGASPG